MRVVVTGGAGFIGSHTVDALLAQGAEVLVIDDLSSGRLSNLEQALRGTCTLEQLDLVGAEARARIVAFAPEAIFHLGAQIDVRKSVSDPTYDARVNITGTINVAEAAAECAAHSFVFSSTGGALYGDVEGFADEDHPIVPAAPYGVGKYCAEQYLDYFGRECGLRCVRLRYGNVYGPRQDPHGEAGVVAIFAQRIIAHQQPLIFGDGSATRDYVHVSDVVAANLMGLSALPSGAYNVGTGSKTDVIAIYTCIREALDIAIPPKFEDARPGELRTSGLDAGKLQAQGWSPKVKIYEGLAQTALWFAEEAAG